MVETTQTKPSATSGLVNQVENKLLTNQATSTTTPLMNQGYSNQTMPMTSSTGLANPLQAPPPQQGVVGTGLSGSNVVGATPLTTTGTGYGTTGTGYGTQQQPHQGIMGKVKDALTGHHSTTGAPLTTGTGYSTGTTGTGLTGTTPLATNTGYTSGTQMGTGYTSGNQMGTGYTSGTQMGTGYSSGYNSGTSMMSGDRLSTGYTTGTTYSSGSALRSSTSETLISQPIVNNRQSFVENVATQIINEKPVLERVEKIVHKDIVEKPHILEQHEKELIEVHEQPIEKRIMHATQEFHVQEENLFETTGRADAESERSRILEQMRLQDMNRRVDVQEHQDVRVTQQAPTVQLQQELRKEIIQKPIVTEIHEQPILEIHEQNIHKTVYERPVVNVIREAPIIESTITTSQPLSGLESTITHGMHSMNLGHTEFIQQQPIVQPVVIQQPIVQQPVLSTTLVEKSLTDRSPHITTNTGINPPVTRK